MRGKHFYEVNSFHVNCEHRFFKCFKMQMVINLAPASLSNKKVNFYTCLRLTFLKKNATENAHKSIFEPLDCKICGGGGGRACPQTPLKVRAFCARNLPRLVLKSGYSPDSVYVNDMLMCSYELHIITISTFLH